MERNGWFDDSYMWSSTPFLLQKTDRGGREMGGQLLHGPLLHSALSDRKAHRARREMSGQLLQDVKKGVALNIRMAMDAITHGIQGKEMGAMD